MVKPTRYQQDVRQQYEDYPYPPRDPQDERTRLKSTKFDYLPLINHYGFNGRLTYDGFRALIAGDGTGDSSIFLAEQLRPFNATVVALDLSEASMRIAKARAQVRQLTNIEWRHASLLDLPQLELESFDYIGCSGVLHHLEDPSEGLRALLSVLKPNGLLGLMLYAKIGRTAVYQMQDLFQMLLDPELSIQTRIDQARQVLEQLPPSNWFKRSQELTPDWETFGDIGLYDLFLHSCDRAYTIREVAEFLAEQNVTLAALAHAPDRLRYQPELYLQDRNLLEHVRSMPRIQQWEIGERLCGSIMLHSFFASANPQTTCQPNDPDHVPFLLDFDALPLQRALKAQPGVAQSIELANGLRLNIHNGPATATLLESINGRRNIRDVLARVVSQTALSVVQVHRDFQILYQQLNSADLMLLRKVQSPQLLPLARLQDRVSQLASERVDDK